MSFKKKLASQKKNIISIRLGSIFLQEDFMYKKSWIVHPILIEVNTEEAKINWEAQNYHWITLDELSKYPLHPGFEDVLKNIRN